jgi:uncharacterized lipoprotein NlpE involved in copper resistance
VRIVTIAAVAALGLTVMACENKTEKAREAAAESSNAATESAAAASAAQAEAVRGRTGAVQNPLVRQLR